MGNKKCIFRKVILSTFWMEGYEIKAFIQKLPATEEMLVKWKQKQRNLHLYSNKAGWKTKRKYIVFKGVLKQKLKSF